MHNGLLVYVMGVEVASAAVCVVAKASSQLFFFLSTIHHEKKLRSSFTPHTARVALLFLALIFPAGSVLCCDLFLQGFFFVASLFC